MHWQRDPAARKTACLSAMQAMSACHHDASGTHGQTAIRQAIRTGERL
jgi:hypothetical protein